MFKSYRVTSAYGWRIHPISKKRSFHGGIDLVKGHQSPIYAFIAGTVLYSGVGRSGTGLGGYGNVVVVKDSKGYAHVYAHLDQVRVRKGQRVSQGSIVGTQGRTGQVTGSHLHYEVRKKTSPSYGWTSTPQHSTVDPVNYVNKQVGTSGGGKRVVRKVTVDGYLGSETIKRTQQFFGTPMDGKMSKPSLVIKNWQRFLNQFTNRQIKVDGYFGKDSVQSLQRFFGTPEDGKLSKPSLVIKEWQKFLNSYGQ